jgi:hypothetical protein
LIGRGEAAVGREGIGRSCGLRGDDYLNSLQVQRSRDGLGDITVNLGMGDEVIILDHFGVGGWGGDWLVGRPCQGFLEMADNGKSRVVWPDGMSLANMGGSKVIAGSTILVPQKVPNEGKDTCEIAGIVARLATKG